MIIKTKKGGAIIVALMISIILGLLSSGLYVVFINSVNGANSQVIKSRLFWAAEAGSNFTTKKLMAEQYSVFIDSTKARLAVKSGIYKRTLIIDGITVNVEAKVKQDAVSNTNWTVTSTANNGSGTCTVKIENIKPQTQLDNSAFFGGESIAGYDYKFRFYGKIYFNGAQKIIWTSGAGKGGPRFYGLVESGSSRKTIGLAGNENPFASWSSYENSNLSNRLAGTTYEKGLAEVNSPNDANASAALNRFDDIFKASKNGVGYRTNSNPIDIKDLADSWNNIRTDSKTLIIAPTVSSALDGKDMRVVYTVLGGKTYADLYVKPKNPAVTTQNQWVRMEQWCKGTVNSAGIVDFQNVNTPTTNLVKGRIEIQDGQTLFIHGQSGWNGDVYVNGVTNKTVSLVTKRSNIMIDGDLYVDGLANSGINNKPFQKLTDAEILSDANFESAAHKLQQEIAKSTVKIGLVAGQGAGGEGGDPVTNHSTPTHKSDIVLYPSAANKDGTILFTTAALHTPAGVIKTYNKGGGDYAGSWNNYGDIWPVLTTWMNAGCMAVNIQGQVADTNNRRGFNMAMVGDPRYMEKGDRPPGFLYGITTDPKRPNKVFNKIANSCRWSISWN